MWWLKPQRYFSATTEVCAKLHSPVCVKLTAFWYLLHITRLRTQQLTVSSMRSTERTNQACVGVGAASRGLEHAFPQNGG